MPGRRIFDARHEEIDDIGEESSAQVFGPDAWCLPAEDGIACLSFSTTPRSMMQIL